jgi:cobalamin biosynthesis protein CobT
LEKHLREVIEWIETATPIELLAIGRWPPASATT